MPKYWPKTNGSASGRAIRPRQRSSAAVSQRLRIAANLEQHESSPRATQTHGNDTSLADLQAPSRDPKEPTVQLPGPIEHEFAEDPPQRSQPTWPGHIDLVPDIGVTFPTSGHQQTAATARPAGDNDHLLILNSNEIDIFVSNQNKEKNGIDNLWILHCC